MDMVTQQLMSRIWRHVSPTTVPWKKYSKKFEFSVLSYNILSQLLLENNKYLYRNIKGKYLTKHRFELIIEEIESYDADIFCLQEFDHQILDYFTEHFAPKGYDHVFERKPNIPFQEKDDGCFMMFRTNKFRLLSNVSQGLYVPEEKLLNKPNCAQIVLFECKDGSQLCVANTHLLYNPRRGDIKLAQLGRILHNVQKLINPSQECGGIPVVFCGDFNTCPNAPLYNLMKYGRLQYSDFTSDKISGQKGGRNIHTIGPGLWNHSAQGYHEHGLCPRSEEELSSCRETHRSLTQSATYLNQEYRDLKCFKCGVLYPYKQGSMSHNINFRSAYDHVDSDGCTKEITTYIQNDARTVDYIWYSNHDNSQQNCAHGHTCNSTCSSSLLLLNARRRLLTKPELTNMGKLPNFVIGSDHQALQAKFTLYSDPQLNSFGRNATSD